MAKPSTYTDEEIAGFFERGDWERITISQTWDRNAVEHPDEVAVEDPQKALTWREAKSWIDRVARGLVDLGIERDQTLVAQLPNSVELLLLRVACEKAGILCIPVYTTMREHEVQYIVEYTGAVAVVIRSEFRRVNYVEMVRKIRPSLPRLKHVVIVDGTAGEGEITIDELGTRPAGENDGSDLLESRRLRPEETSIVCLTSGSTGFPKFVEYPGAACTGDGKELAQLVKVTPSDIVAAIAPAARGPNVTVYYGAAHIPARCLMVPWVNAKESLKLIEQKRVTVACVVPTQLAMMLQELDGHPYDTSSVRMWISGGAVLPASLAREVEERMGGITLSQYGAVDFGRMTIPRPEYDFVTRSATVGKPGRGTTVKLVDDSGAEVPRGHVGAIIAKGAFCSTGYYKDPKATREVWNAEGWYNTGDLGKFDEEGNLIIAGRQKDMIIRGGQNIIPVEVESLLVTHPKIQSAAIVAMPDAIMGEKACAYIVPKGEDPLTLEELVPFLKEHGLAPFKIPERIEIVSSFPTVADGQKVDKKALAKDIAEKLKTEMETRG